MFVDNLSMQKYIAHIKEINSTDKYVEALWIHVKDHMKQKIRSHPNHKSWQIVITNFSNIDHCSKLSELLRDTDTLKRFVGELNASESKDTITAEFRPPINFLHASPKTPMGITFEIKQIEE